MKEITQDDITYLPITWTPTVFKNSFIGTIPDEWRGVLARRYLSVSGGPGQECKWLIEVGMNTDCRNPWDACRTL